MGDLNAGAMSRRQMGDGTARRWLGRGGGSRREPKPNPSIRTIYFFLQMASKKPLDVKVILKESYIKAIKNSVGSNLFRNFYAFINGKKKDILENGVLSCAAFTSSILYLFKLTTDTHATVKGTVADLEKSGWVQTKKPREGAVLVWEILKFGGNDMHRHIGFYVGKNKAISNSKERGYPILHHWTFGVKNGRPVRKVEQIFWNKKIDQTL